MYIFFSIFFPVILFYSSHFSQPLTSKYTLSASLASFLLLCKQSDIITCLLKTILTILALLEVSYFSKLYKSMKLLQISKLITFCFLTYENIYFIAKIMCFSKGNILKIKRLTFQK